MEVHHHSHHGKRKWTEYFWEFLMLFLAVTLGFFVENQREHYVEHQREKQYIRSMIEDLKTDTSNLNEVIKGLVRKSSQLDTVLNGFEAFATKYNQKWSQLFLRTYREGFPDFYPTDRTIQQLKNAGGLRLIRNEEAAKGIIDYDAFTRDVSMEEGNINGAQKEYLDNLLKVWSIRKMYADAGVTSWTKNRTMQVKDNYWLSTDPDSREHIFNLLAEFNEAILRQIVFDNQLKQKAATLIELLEKEYHL